jgi:hypothetical protein
MVRRKRGDVARTRRERFFECVFAVERNEYRFHLRAWTPEEAAYQLDAELRENGFAIPGELHVLGSRGEVLLSVEYAPRRSVPRPHGDEQR